MSKKFKWLLIHLIFAVMVFGAYFLDIQGAYNITVAIVVLNFLASLVYLSEKMHKELSDTGRSVPDWLNRTFDWLLIGVFAWFGSFLLLVLYLLSTIFEIYGRAKADELSKADPA